MTDTDRQTETDRDRQTDRQTSEEMDNSRINALYSSYLPMASNQTIKDKTSSATVMSRSGKLSELVT